MQKIKELLGICNHEFKVARAQQLFVVDGRYEYCFGVKTEFDIICQKCGEHNTHSTNITRFSKPIKIQEDPENYSFPTQEDENEVEFNADLKLKQLKYKYKIK